MFRKLQVRLCKMHCWLRFSLVYRPSTYLSLDWITMNWKLCTNQNSYIINRYVSLVQFLFSSFFFHSLNNKFDFSQWLIFCYVTLMISFTIDSQKKTFLSTSQSHFSHVDQANCKASWSQLGKKFLHFNEASLNFLALSARCLISFIFSLLCTPIHSSLFF